MVRPTKIRHKKHRRLIVRLLAALWSLDQIAGRLRVHPQTLSRFVHADSVLEQQYYDSYLARLCQHIAEKEYKGDHRDHPLRAIFLYEKFHLQDLTIGKRRQSAHYRNAIVRNQETCAPPPIGTEPPICYNTTAS